MRQILDDELDIMICAQEVQAGNKFSATVDGVIQEQRAPWNILLSMSWTQFSQP